MSNKRTVTFQEETSDQPKSRRFKEDHSLDSDNEESVEKKETNEGVLNEDDIEGQEDETIRNDEGIAVTPFNLKDELEEGHFDGEGNYIADKIEEVVADRWLDSVDWSKIRDTKETCNYEEPVEEEITPIDPIKIKTEIVTLMNPGENILKSLRRLGGSKKPISSADRWKKKKAKIEEPAEDEKTKQDKANLLKLTGLADSLLQNGDFQIYEKKYEQLNFELEQKLSQFEDAGKDDDDDDDALEDAFNQQTKETIQYQGQIPLDNNKTDSAISDEVMWLYKKENTESSELFGPFSSTKMSKMQEEGLFKNTVYCRKVSAEGSFYSSNRIDFDLYM